MGARIVSTHQGVGLSLLRRLLRLFDLLQDIFNLLLFSGHNSLHQGQILRRSRLEHLAGGRARR